MSEIYKFTAEKAAEILLDSFIENNEKLDEINSKLDTLIYSGYATACRHLEESRDVSGGMRREKLSQALERFEDGDDRLHNLVLKQRDKLRNQPFHATGEWDIDSSAMIIGANEEVHDAKAYRAVAKHGLWERAWLLNRAGALRVAIELQDYQLVNIKEQNLNKGIEDAISFLRHAFVVISSRTARLRSQDISVVVLARALTRPFVKSTHEYYEETKSEYVRCLSGLEELKRRN